MGVRGPGSAILLPSCRYPIPGEQGLHGRAAATHPASHGNWEDNKLSLHLFLGKGWFVVCTIISGPWTSPTRVTSCPKSSSRASSSLSSSSVRDGGALLAPQTPTQVPLTPGMEEQQQSSPAQGLALAQHTKPGKPRGVAAGILQTPRDRFVGFGKVEAAGFCPWIAG